MVAAAVAEDAANERGDRDEVGWRKRRRPRGLPDRRVFGREHRQPVERALGLGDVSVDAGDVVGGVGDDLGALGKAGDVVDLVLFVLVGIRLTRPHALIHAQVRAAGEPGQVPGTGVAQRIDHEQAILGGGVADAEHERRPCVAVDVRNPVGLVTHDRDARLGALGAGDLSSRDAEGRVLEELRDLRRLDVGRGGGQPRVHLQLVV